MKTKKYTRNDQLYTAFYNEGRLLRLVNETTGRDIPQDTKSFR